MDLDVFSFGFVPLLTEAGDSSAIQKAVADLNDYVSRSHPSASHGLNVSSFSESNGDRPLLVNQGLTASGVAGTAGATPSVATDTVPFMAKSGSGTRSMLLTTQPSAVATFSWTAESASPSKSGSGGVKGSSSNKKLGVDRLSNAIKKPEKTGHRNKVVPSLGKIRIKILVPSTAVSTAGACTGALSTHEVAVVELDDDGSLTVPPRSSLGPYGASGL